MPSKQTGVIIGLIIILLQATLIVMTYLHTPIACKPEGTPLIISHIPPPIWTAQPLPPETTSKRRTTTTRTQSKAALHTSAPPPTVRRTHIKPTTQLPECDGVCTAWLHQLHNHRTILLPSVIEYRHQTSFLFNSLEMSNVVVDFGAISKPITKWPIDEKAEYFAFDGPAFYLVSNMPKPNRIKPTPNAAINKEAANANYIDSVWSATAITDAAHRCTITIDRPTVFVKRYEYANIWHQYSDWFNALVADELLALSNQSRAYFDMFDLHPPTQLDDVWRAAFSNPPATQNITTLWKQRSIVCYRRLVFAAVGYQTRVAQVPDKLASTALSDLHQKLRQRILSGFSLSVPAVADKCVIVLRRDYVAHPRNPSGRVVRKWANESAIAAAAKAAGWTNCQLVDLVTLTPCEQLDLIRQTVLFIGVHGAALTLLAFLPINGAVVEVTVNGNKHFAQLANHTKRKYVTVAGKPDKGAVTVAFNQTLMVSALTRLH